MALVKRSFLQQPGQPKFLVGGKGKAAVGKPKIQVSLPTELSEAIHDLSQYHLLIHGEKKIGKTTLTTVEENVFLLSFDPIQKALELFQRHVPTWDHFMAYLEKLEALVAADKYPYRRVVIDGADIWHRRCQDWVCKKLVITHPSDEEWGKAWSLLKETFSNAVDRLLALPGGCWFISHSTWREVETRSGHKVPKLVPLLSGSAEEILVGKVDGWFAYDYMDTERVLVVRGDERTGAGHRIRGHFLTPDGRMVTEIPMGGDEFESWNNLIAAFNNEQAFATLEERDGVARDLTPRLKKAFVAKKKR